MAYKVNYGLERAERNRQKQAKKEAKLRERKEAAARGEAPPADDEPEDRALRGQQVVSGEHRLARSPELAVNGEVRQGGLLGLRIRFRHRALLLHESVEGVTVDAEAELFRDLEREVDRKTEGVV